MKKILFMLCLIGMISTAQAQFGGLFGGFGGVMPVYDAASAGHLISQLSKTQQLISQAQEQIAWAEESWKLEDNWQKRLFKLNGMANLQWNNLESLFEKSMLLGSDPRSYFEHRIPYILDFHQLLNTGGEPQDTRRLYEFFHQKTTAYDPASSMAQLLTQKSSQQEKRYAAEMYAQQQKLQLSMAYMQEAEHQAIRAEELRRKVAEEGAMSLSEGERIMAQDAASNAMIESMKMRQSGHQLYQEALHKSPTQQQVDWLQQANMLRQSKANLLANFLPGN